MYLIVLNVYIGNRQPTERAKYSYFYIIWSLKEAFIKAIGQGLGYDLKEVSYSTFLEYSAEKTPTEGSIADFFGMISPLFLWNTYYLTCICIHICIYFAY